MPVILGSRCCLSTGPNAKLRSCNGLVANAEISAKSLKSGAGRGKIGDRKPARYGISRGFVCGVPLGTPDPSAVIVRARWPALMSESDAAEYVGVSVSEFRRERDAGKMPRPVDRGCRRNTYSRRALDAAVARLDGGVDTAVDHNEWDDR